MSEQLDTSQKKNAVLVLNILGTILLGWCLVKASIIGYYPSELIPLIIVPGLIGLGLAGVAKLIAKQ